MLTCPKSTTQGSVVEPSEYTSRCALIREERGKRSLKRKLEEMAWSQICTTFADETEAVRAREEAKKVANTGPLKARPPSFDYRYRAGATVSVLPLGESLETLTEKLLLSATSKTDDSLIKLWESENRADLEEWESVERYRMTQTMQSILAAECEYERAVRERALQRALSGTTVLDWTSYPRYEGSSIVS
ncbi:hypothetical protein JKF63_01801 [Porcisia hertigi]|uniref:Uncharacterized protein n=1 Tax=Porcisia hertigi TaxID=2761500 RepID=A0A836L0Q5_9TRYP|nr:hypothetical protein JKF63_01801 [Porcisia hertigi]